MEKYIKVSDAIKTFKALPNCDNGYSDVYDKATIIGVLEEMPPAQQWIPVSERLPEERLSVLVWCPAVCCIFCAYRNEDKWWIFGASHTAVWHDVTAWMYVPEPYKDKTE